jgi:hypothetical protein
LRSADNLEPDDLRLRDKGKMDRREFLQGAAVAAVTKLNPFDVSQVRPEVSLLLAHVCHKGM